MAAACAALALTAAAATAQTVPPDRTTFVTFSGPVSVPGTTLPAGTYTFRLLNSDTNRNIVQIFDKDSMKLYTTLLAVPATRRELTGDPIITFKETPSDRPPAVHYWYYAGETAGNELVYPKNQAMAIASASGESVMSVDSDGSSIDDWKSGTMSRVDGKSQSANGTTGSATSSTTSSTTSSSTTGSDTTSAQQPTSSTQQPTSAPMTTQPAPTTTADTTSQSPAPAPTTTQPAPTTTQPAPTTADQTPAPRPAPTTVPAPSASPDTAQPVGTSGSLPKTASELPLIGLIGLLALGGAVALRAARTA